MARPDRRLSVPLRVECPYREDGRYRYEDAEHFSVYGSGLAVAEIFPLLEEAPAESNLISEIKE